VCVDPDALTPEYAVIVTWIDGRVWRVCQDTRSRCAIVKKNLMRFREEGVGVSASIPSSTYQKPHRRKSRRFPAETNGAVTTPHRGRSRRSRGRA